MANVHEVIAVMLVAGIILLLCGVLVSRYPRRKFLNINNGITLEGIANSRLGEILTYVFVNNPSGRLYRITRKCVISSESNISVKAVYLLKIMSFIVVSTVLLCINYTNLNVEKITIISNFQQTDVLKMAVMFKDDSVKSGKLSTGNTMFYNEVVTGIGEDMLDKLDDKGKFEAAKKVIPGLINSNNSKLVEARAINFVKTFNSVNNLRMLDFTTVLIMLLSFWLPELFLLIRVLLLSNTYKKEIIKLENIFELLGSVKDFKTIDILNEMSNCATIYKKHLRSAMESFQMDKKLALEHLKLSVKNKRFTRLVEIIKTYSLVDKQLAIGILVRNRMEKEEQILLTAQEDLDIVDMIAFVSIVPILYEIVNLLLKPMMDMVFEAFKYM